MESVKIGTRFAILAWKLTFVCTSREQLFVFSHGGIRASQSTWTSALAGWVPTLFLTAAPAGKWDEGKCGCWWSPCSTAPRAVSGCICTEGQQRLFVHPACSGKPGWPLVAGVETLLTLLLLRLPPTPQTWSCSCSARAPCVFADCRFLGVKGSFIQVKDSKCNY